MAERVRVGKVPTRVLEEMLSGVLASVSKEDWSEVSGGDAEASRQAGRWIRVTVT